MSPPACQKGHQHSGDHQTAGLFRPLSHRAGLHPPPQRRVPSAGRLFSREPPVLSEPPAGDSTTPEASNPERWLTFLHELLDDADIPTLQEYLGYCLIPSTKGQKMMLIVGKGGEGKSRIGWY